MEQQDWIKAWLCTHRVGGSPQSAVRLEKQYAGPDGQRYIFKVWLSVDEAKALAENLPLLLQQSK